MFALLGCLDANSSISVLLGCLVQTAVCAYLQFGGMTLSHEFAIVVLMTTHFI
jgi:hypothetical protein